jgi:ribokinase
MIICLGDLMVDVFGGDDGPRRSHLGGKAANYAAMVRAFGRPAAVIGSVGDDPEGRRLLDVLGGLGVDVSGIAVRPDAATGADFFENGTWRMERGANWEVTAEQVRDALDRLAAGAEAVIVNQGVIATASEEAVRYAREHDLFLVLNLAPEAVEPKREIDPALFPAADVTVVNQLEAEVLVERLGLACSTTDPDELAAALFRATAPRHFLILTRGPGGATVAIRDGDGPTLVTVPATDAVAADLEHHIGAGDAMLGAIVALVAHQRSAGASLTPDLVAEIVTRGVEVARASLDHAGTMTAAVEDAGRFRAWAYPSVPA